MRISDLSNLCDHGIPSHYACGLCGRSGISTEPWAAQSVSATGEVHPPIDQQARAEKAEALNKRWNIAASLSYAGSEFIDEPERIFTRVRETQSVQMHSLCDEKRERQKAESERDAALAKYQVTLEARDVWERNHKERCAEVIALQAELAAIKKRRREWGFLTQSGNFYACKNETNARLTVSGLPGTRTLAYRTASVPAGPWETPDE